MDEIISSVEPAGTRPDPDPRGRRRSWDRTTRRAALLATLIALPVAVLVAGFTFTRLAPKQPAAEPGPSVTAAGPQSTLPVEIGAPALAERPATVCRALLSQLPPAIRDLNQRPVTSGAEQNAAYGDPALTVACGITEPSFPLTDDVWVINKVCWHATEETDATVLTTVDREVPVRVAVPRVYEQPLQWVTPISDAIVASVPSGGNIPAGCQG